MAKKNKLQSIDWGQVAGAIIFIVLFFGLIFLATIDEDDGRYNSGFFKDVSEIMKTIN